MRTRHFVQKLWFELKLPVFALMDGDAYGIDIALCYKYGSLNAAYQNHQLVIPEIKWLGINGNDIEEFRLQGTVFSRREKTKFKSLCKRADVKENTDWTEQIIKLKRLGIKVELQSLMDYAPDFLIQCYLPYKLYMGKWI